MTNQMKSLLVAMLICTYCSLGVGAIVFIINGFSFTSFASWLFFLLEIPVAIFGQLLLNRIKRIEKEVMQKIERYKLLQELREGAILKFYQDNGIKPRYNKDGKLETPDEFIGILTKLTKDGKLEPSIYEMLGILPRFDKDGNEIPFVVVIKHLVDSFKTKDLDKLKFKKLILPKTNELQKAEVKKIEKPKVAESAKKEKKAGKKQKIVYGKIVKAKKDKPKGGGEKSPAKKPKAKSVEGVSKETPQHQLEKRIRARRPYIQIPMPTRKRKPVEVEKEEDNQDFSNTR